MNNKYINQSFTGERALFMCENSVIENCIFEDGESPLKHSHDLTVNSVDFKWKYPLWYSRNITVSDSTFHEMARAAVWYTDNSVFKNIKYIAPKGFRRCRGLTLENVEFSDAKETLWQCSDVVLKNVKARGDYLAMNCENMEIDGLDLDGNYSFDGAKNITIRNSRLMSKDSFWNSENITVENSVISGEYLGWNSKKLTLVNCTVESLQGLCFCEDLVLENCTLNNTNLAFEYSTVNAEINGFVESIKNPSGGSITADEIGEIIMESDRVDVSATRIICRKS
ncbi:DUF3737 family protein [Ruminococcus sp. HUN007]|uniref:DUF3737 family protein n=1 Tax=Ruminococcus sp. HUN007 TaxID=1514668 RepID=UPI0005D23BFB|nr:DUF3737 family protein [Ruminococcus sp. HUN007]